MTVCFYLVAVWISIIPEYSGNSGTDFIVSFPDNKYKTDVDPIDIYLTPAVDHVVMVTITAPKFLDFNINITLSLSPGSSEHIEIDERFRMPVGTNISPRTLVIAASDLIDVVCVSIYKSNGDAFLAIPNHLLGKEYMTVTYTHTISIAASFLTVSAGSGSDETRLSITFPKWDGDLRILLNDVWYKGGESAQVSLNSLDTLQIETVNDLTGTFITSNEPVAVYSGVNRTSVYNTKCLSHMLDQMPPIDRAGNSYVTIPFPKRDLGDIYRIVATEDDIVVTMPNGDKVNLISKGDFHEIYLSPLTFYYITATKPVIVAQLSVSKSDSSDIYGDPSLLVLTPTEGAYTNTSFSRASYPESYVTIVLLKQDKDGIRFDDEPLSEDQEWYPVEGTTNYTATQISVGSSSTPHNIYHNDGEKFVAYFHTGTSCEAQAMSLGLSVPVINPPCEAPSSVPGDGIDNDCDGRTDEETCCLNKQPADNDEDGRFNEDCVGYTVNGITKGTCCDSSGKLYACRLISASVQFGKTGHGIKKFAKTILKYSVYTRITCAAACVEEHACWGFNFNPTTFDRENNVINCEILVGDKGGTQEQSAWNFRSVSERIMVYS